jgi:Tol biopolymer transport system component
MRPIRRSLVVAFALASALVAQESRPTSASRPASAPTEDVIAFFRQGKLHVVGTSAGAKERRLSEFDFKYDRPPAWDVGGRRLFCWLNPAGWDVGAVDFATGEVADLTRTHDDCRMARPSPDGAKIAFQRGGVGVCVMDADGRRQKTLTPRGHRDAPPAWSPDGSRIAFMDLENVDERSVRTQVFVVPSKGGEARRVAERADEPSWSADGRTLYVLASRAADGEDIYALDADGDRPPRRVTTDGGSKSDLTFTHDRRCCAYLRYGKDDVMQLMIVDAAGTNARQVAKLEGRPHASSWSPDGARLAYTSGVESRSLWIFDVATGRASRVADDVAWPVWRP